MSHNKRQRITQWSYLSKAWNASNIAEQVAELTDTNEKLTDDLRMCTQHLNQYKKLHNEEKAKHCQYKIAYKNVSSVVAELKEATETTLKTHQCEVDHLKNLSDIQTANNQQQIASLNEENEETIAGLEANYITTITGLKEAAETTYKKHQCEVDHLKHLSDVQMVTNQQQITSLTEEISKMHKENEAKIDGLTVEKLELQRQNAEERGRSKSWRIRYEKLVSDGAAALASKTVAEYGVTPCEVSLFKNFAQKQAAAAKATKLAQEAAIEATQMGFKTIEDA
jgi:hypothetical protein|tara:strand:+ start:197 stop:1042 length:846 start_codon:yes stop_codon:yes gene_type:complete